MRELNVYIEVNGDQTLVGTISGNNTVDAVFSYDDEYLSSGTPAQISVSLPLRKNSFSPDQTRNYFESLLPEGFSRTAVADWAKVDEGDYLTILSILGRECLGAVKIIEGKDTVESEYELLTEARIKELASEGATRSTQILMETHLSLTGATGKVGLYYDGASDRWYLPKGDAPSTHIVKQSHVRLERIVVNEQLCTLTARNLGFNVPESFIISKGADEELLYATKRFDRAYSGEKVINGLPCPLRLHQEDFAQALSIPPNDKYEKTPSEYMKRMFELIRNNSSDPVEDQRVLISSIIFNFLIGNTDCHVKNYSLLYSPDLRSKRLAPIYDLVATRVYNKTTPKMAFFIGGELDIEKIGRTNFVKAAEEIGMSGRMVLSTFDDVAEKFENALAAAADELENMGFKQATALEKEILDTGGYRNI